MNFYNTSFFSKLNCFIDRCYNYLLRFSNDFGSARIRTKLYSRVNRSDNFASRKNITKSQLLLAHNLTIECLFTFY